MMGQRDGETSFVGGCSVHPAGIRRIEVEIRTAGLKAAERCDPLDLALDLPFLAGPPQPFCFERDQKAAPSFWFRAFTIANRHALLLEVPR